MMTAAAAMRVMRFDAPGAAEALRVERPEKKSSHTRGAAHAA